MKAQVGILIGGKLYVNISHTWYKVWRVWPLHSECEAEDKRKTVHGSQFRSSHQSWRCYWWETTCQSQTRQRIISDTIYSSWDHSYLSNDQDLRAKENYSMSEFTASEEVPKDIITICKCSWYSLWSVEGYLYHDSLQHCHCQHRLAEQHLQRNSKVTWW